MRLPVCVRAIMRANITTYAVGYLVGSLATKSINRWVRPARKDEMVSRRQFSRTAAAGLILPALTGRWVHASLINGVRVGVQTYSFRELARPAGGDAVDAIIAAMKTCGLDECELWSPQIEPASTATTAEAREQARQSLREWRVSTPVGHFAGIRKEFAAAGITIFAYNLSFSDSFSDDEIDRGFEHARALGAEVITASTTLAVAKRLVPFAAKHRIPVAMHNHSRVDDPNEFATPVSFTTALAMSPLFRVNLDIGHFTAADFDALAFIEAHHDRITNLHIKDRKRHQGDNVPWGEGDTPIRETLAWLKARRSPIRAYIEYEYKGARGAVDEVKTCLAYVTKALAS
jgi:sugar phosphate isomerase/epimerase